MYIIQFNSGQISQINYAIDNSSRCIPFALLEGVCTFAEALHGNSTLKRLLELAGDVQNGVPDQKFAEECCYAIHTGKPKELPAEDVVGSSSMPQSASSSSATLFSFSSVSSSLFGNLTSNSSGSRTSPQVAPSPATPRSPVKPYSLSEVVRALLEKSQPR